MFIFIAGVLYSLDPPNAYLWGIRTSPGIDAPAWDCTPSEMVDVMEDPEVWRLNVELLLPQPSRKRKRAMMKEEASGSA